MPLLYHVVIALVLAGLVLWAITQFPLDATIAKIIRVVVVVAVVLWLLGAFFGFPAIGAYRYR